MIVLYRYVKKKREEKKREQEAQAQAVGGANGGDIQEVQVEQAEEPAPTPKAKKPSNWRWHISLAVALAIPVYIDTLDYTVVATAQTHIASAFDRLDLQSWIGTAYLLTSTVFLPFFASVADIYGRHFAIQLSLIIFMFGSALSTGARNMEMMIGGRAIAGIGGAGLIAVIRTIMSDSSSLNSNSWQTATIFFLYTIGYCTGPVIGGALLTVSFRWIFAINLPAGAIAMVLNFLLLRGKVKDGRPSERIPQDQPETYFSKLLRIDWIATVLFVGGGILVLLALNMGSTQNWNEPVVILGFVLGGVLFIACLVWEYILERPRPSSKLQLFYAEPMIPLDTLTVYDVVVVQFGSFVGGMIMFVMFYFVAIYMIVVTGLASTNAGVQLIYFAPGMGGGTLIALPFIRRTRQPKYPIILGSAVIPVALGLISMAMNNNNQGQVNGFMVMAGIGCGLTMAPLVIHARFSLHSKRAAIVAAMSLFFRAFGGTVGLAQCGAVLNAKVRSTIISAIESGIISPSDAASSATNLNGPNSVDVISQLSPAAQAVVRDAFKQGTRWAFISLVPWAAIAFLLSLFLSNIRTDQKKEEEEEKKDTGIEMTIPERPVEEKSEDAVEKA